MTTRCIAAFVFFVSLGMANGQIVITLTGNPTDTTATFSASGSLAAPATAQTTTSNGNVFLPIGNSWTNTFSIALPGFETGFATSPSANLSSVSFAQTNGESFNIPFFSVFANGAGDDTFILKQSGGSKTYQSAASGGGDVSVSGTSTFTVPEGLTFGQAFGSPATYTDSSSSYSVVVQSAAIPEPSGFLCVALIGLVASGSRRAMFVRHFLEG